MPRAKSASTAKTNSRGGSKRLKGKDEKVKDEVVDLCSDDENDIKDDEDSEGALPSVPVSAKAVKKVMLLPKDIRLNGFDKIQEFLLPHPRTGNKSLFLLDCGDENETKQLTYEVLTMQQDTRSWFVDNNVLSDGNLYVTTPVDPLFLILPILVKTDKWKPIRDHFEDSILPRNLIDIFVNSLSSKHLENISAKKDLDDIVVYRYSEDKTLSWLAKKVEKVTKFLTEKGISSTKASVSSNFVSKDVPTSISKEESTRFASDIVSEYLEGNIKKKLFEHLGLPILPEKTGLKRKNDEDVEDESNKKSKIMNNNDTPVKPLEDYGSETSTPTNKAHVLTAKEKVLQKAAQNSHSLLKFFSPKPK